MPDTIVAEDSTAGLRALAPPGLDRRRVLLAPVTVTPSKPLAPSHLKGLLWTDVMYRATSVLADVFWEFLDRAVGAADYSGMTEVEIGELYVRFRAEGRAATAATLRPYAEAVESQGWVHPAARRVLGLWASH
ncbi:hypothetical protein [Streptomyces sp. NPDC007856]|uniref:hypothetical protein n=1 Tax=Streptomyces sp. NPDC007856 TaxID=3364781 RepID=UPI0036A75E77